MIPDLVCASHERIETGLDAAGHFVIAPELMVEVLSLGGKNEQRDKKLKLKLYSLHGVQEYWIINWRLKEIEVYRREDAMLQKVVTLLATELLATELLVTDKLTSPLLPGFECAISSLFRQ